MRTAFAGHNQPRMCDKPTSAVRVSARSNRAECLLAGRPLVCIDSQPECWHNSLESPSSERIQHDRSIGCLCARNTRVAHCGLEPKLFKNKITRITGNDSRYLCLIVRIHSLRARSWHGVESSLSSAGTNELLLSRRAATMLFHCCFTCAWTSARKTDQLSRCSPCSRKC